jgi:SAM-dependent methyltransferase
VSTDSAPAALIEAASAYYRRAGRFARIFARRKLAADPVYAAILAQGLLAGRVRILDLGCGQGLLAAWLLAAHAYHAGGARAGGPAGWPPAWPVPPWLETYRGVEISGREAARARHAFALDPGARLEIVHADISDVDYGTADAVVILDVLHYIDHTAQERVLARVHTALAPRGRLLLRIGDAAGGAGFTLGKAVDRTVALARRRHWRSLACRPALEWQELLARLGFRACPQPMSRGTPFANVLLVAHPA